MANPIVYCDQCGKMIAPKEMASGQVIITPTASICGACAGSLTAEQRAAILRLATPAQAARPAPGRKSPAASGSRGSARMTAATHTSSRRRGVEVPTRTSEEAAKKAKMAMAGIAGAVVVLIIAAVVLMGRGPAEPAPQQTPVADTPADPAPQVEPDVTGQQDAGPISSSNELAEIRGLFTPNLDNYAQMVERLQALLAANPDDANAKALLDDVEVNFGQLAERQLSRAERMARVQANGGDIEGAIGRIDAAIRPYEGTPWYEREGADLARRIRDEIQGLAGGPTGIPTTRDANNAVTNSHFENLDDGGRLIDWATTGNVEVSRDHYGRYVRVHQPRPVGSSFIEGRFELDPAWRELHVSCQLKGENINPATGNDRAGVIVTFQDRDRRDIARNVSGAPSLTSSAEWQRYDMRAAIPEGAAFVHLRLGLFGTAGTLSVDHVFAGPIQARTIFVRRPAGSPAGPGPGPGDPRPTIGISKAENIREAVSIAKAGNFARAKEFLADINAWDREGEREIARELLAAIEEAERIGGLEGDAWARFLAGLVDASKKGLGEARRFIDNERRNVPAEHRAKFDLADRRLRNASLVKEMIVDGLRLARGFVRLDERGTDRRISGRIRSIEGEDVTVAPAVGAPEVVRLGDISAESLIVASGLNRTMVASSVQIASFAFFIGDTAHAKELAGADDESRAIVADIEMLALGAKPAPDFDRFLARLDPQTGPRDTPSQDTERRVTTDPQPGPTAGPGPTADSVPDVPVEAEPGNWPKRPLPAQMGLPGQWAPGLVMEIFEGGELRKRYGTRIERSVLGLWGVNTPDGMDVPALRGGYSVRWSGWLLIPAKGSYVFTSTRVSVRIDGKTLGRAGTEMEPGLYPIEARLHNPNNSSVLPSLSWAFRGIGNTVIPDGYFFHRVPEYGSMGPPTKLVQGLWVEYFADHELGRKVFEGHTPTPDFHIPETHPLHPMLQPRSDFGLRYTTNVFFAAASTGHLIRAFIDTTCGMRTIFNGRTMDEAGLRDRVTWDGRRVDASLGDAPAGQHKIVMEYWGRGESMINTNVTMTRPRDSLGFVSYRDLREDEKWPQPDRTGYAPGLKATFTGTNRTRVEAIVPTLHLPYNKESPVVGIPGEGFQVTMDGFVIVPESGVYNIFTSYAGAFSLSIGGRPIANDNVDSGSFKLASNMVPLRAGATPIRITYMHNNGDSGFTVRWAGPSLPIQPIANGFVAHRASELTINKLPEPVTPEDVIVDDRPPGTDGPAKAWQIPQGNIFPNPSFEEAGTDNLPRGWLRRNFGRGDYDVRLDTRGETRTGQNAARLHSTGEGARAGLVTMVTQLPPGRYEIKFWALPDIDQTAVIRLRVGDQDQPPLTVSGDTYREYRQTLTLVEGQENVEVGLTSASQARVWLDDVEMTYIGR